MPARARWSAARVATAAAVAAGLGAVALVVFAAGRPVATDDLWWHLALGRHFASEGPWLADDPLIFDAPGPPSNASWLADVAFAGVHAAGGFHGLRFVAAALAAAVLALAARLLWRASGSRAFAGAALVAFATLAAYRLFQMRPQLATFLCVLALYAFALRPRDGPSPLAVAGGVALMALWANLHAAFPLGPLLAASAACGVLAPAAVGRRAPTPRERTRTTRLTALAALGALATLANPSGFEQHLAWFASGAETPALERVRDEWRPLALFALPTAIPPSLASWAIVWLLLVASAAATWRALCGWRGTRAEPDADAPDPALVALAWLGLAAGVLAVRFLWLGVFALLLLGQAWRARADTAPRGAAALAAVVGLVAFVGVGPWPRIATPVAGYAEPFRAWKYFAEPVWLLRDAGVEGRLYTDYSVGGFAGFWLAPGVKTLVNGSLNVRPEALDAFVALRRRRGAHDGESFAQLLDRLGIDLFHGVRMPAEGLPPTRPVTSAHLDGVAGWKLVFRNARSALWLRDDAANAPKLERIARHYARAGVPFDPEVGFDAARVLRERPDWAVAQRLVPRGFPELGSGERVAIAWALLGLCEPALEADAEVLALRPRDAGALRRRVACLLRLGRHADAAADARGLADADEASRRIATLARLAARRAREGALPEALEARLRTLPWLGAREAEAVAASLAR